MYAIRSYYGTRGLEFLSLDYVGPRGFLGEPADRIALMFIAEDGDYTFTLPQNVGVIRVDFAIVFEAEPGEPTVEEIHLSRGWHFV